MGSIPGAGKIPHAMEQQSLCARNIKPVVQGLGTAPTEAWVALEPMVHNKEKPPQRKASAAQLESSACLPQLDTGTHGSDDPVQPKISN